MAKLKLFSYYQWAIDSYEYPVTIDINESLELNPEKPEGGERRVEGNISIKQIIGAKLQKILKKGGKKT